MTTESALTIDHEVLGELIASMKAHYIEEFGKPRNADEWNQLLGQLYFVVVEPFETVYPDDTPTPEGWDYGMKLAVKDWHELVDSDIFFFVDNFDADVVHATYEVISMLDDLRV